MGGMVSNAINQSGLPNAINQAGFQQQLGRVSNQMYQPPNQMGGYDPYTAMRRPNYMPFGPNQQFYQPIYQPSYSQFSNFGYGQAPFGGFYQPPMMGMMGRGLQGGQQMGMAPGNMATNYGDFDPRFRPQQSNMLSGQATYLTDQFQPMMPPQQAQQQAYAIPYSNAPQPRLPFGGLRSMRPVYDAANAAYGSGAQQQFQPMLSPQPVQTQYRPIPMASQTSIDQIKAQAMAEGVNQGMSQAQSSYGGGAKAGGKVEDDGIASLLKK
jgi:hypothetical protein